MRLPIIALALTLSTPLHAEVWTVDMDGFGHWTSIQDAVDAAADGDTLLIRSPIEARLRYDGFTIDGKSLTVRGEGRPTLFTGPVSIENLDLGQSVTLIGLDMNRRLSASGNGYTPQVATGPGLCVTDSRGAVRVQSCFMEGSAGIRLWAGLQLTRALDVTLVKCSVLGAIGPSLVEEGGNGLQCVSSRLAAFESGFLGGVGHSGWGSYHAFAGDGGIGATLSGRSFAWFGGCEITGGVGGLAECTIYYCQEHSGDGGIGLTVQAGSVCIESASTIFGGPGGPYAGTGSSYVMGSTGVASVGSYVSAPQSHRSLQSADAARVDAPLRFSIEGVPGESVRLALAEGGGLRYIGADRGLLLCSDYLPAQAFAYVGVIPLGGVLEVTVPPPFASGPGAADPGFAKTIFAQVALDGAGGALRMSSPCALEILGHEVPTSFDGQRVYVDASAPLGGNGTSWGRATPSLDDALRRAATAHTSGIEIWAREGHYRPAGVLGFYITSNTHLFGGFAGGETEVSEADPGAHRTILDADRAGDGSGPMTSADNAYGVVTLGTLYEDQIARDVVLRGLDFTNSVEGYSIGTAGVTVYGDATLIECRVYGNRSGQSAIRHRFGELELERCWITGNEGVLGGGLYSDDDRYGPGRVRLVNCVVAGNHRSHTSSYGSAGVYVRDGHHVELHGCTIADNTCSSCTGGVLIHEHASFAASNTVVSGNTDGQPYSNLPRVSRQLLLNPHVIGGVQWSLIEALEQSGAGFGNLDAAASFEDRLGADGVAGTLDEVLRLRSGTAGVDAGSNVLVPMGSLFDFVGRPRVADDPGTPNTGQGGTRVVDMGAYER